MHHKSLTHLSRLFPPSIGRKIALSFGVIFILFVTLGVMIIVNVRTMNREGSYEVQYKDPQAFLVNRAEAPRVDPETGRVDKSSRQTFQFSTEAVTQRNKAALETEASTRNMIFVLVVLAFIISVVVGTLLIRSIIVPMKVMMKNVQRISKGDYDIRLEISTNDEFSLLAENFNKMAQDLKQSRQALEEKMEVIRQLSLTDPLTGLYNRRGFISLMEHQLSSAQRNKQKISVIYADMDNLKVFNDTRGHTYGDQALSKIAIFLKEEFRQSDIIARVGGDEFAIGMTDQDAVGAEIIRRRLIDKINEYNSIKRDPYPIEISIGIVVAEPGDGQDIDKLLTSADKLMYEDKKKRKLKRS